MEALLKEYDFETESQYYEYIYESVVNGQRKQARSLFHEMPQDNRLEFVDWVYDNINRAEEFVFDIIKYVII